MTTDLILLPVEDEEHQSDQILLVRPEVLPVLPGGDSVEYNQVLARAHLCGSNGFKVELVQIQISTSVFHYPTATTFFASFFLLFSF